jgi:hypothetical protein
MKSQNFWAAAFLSQSNCFHHLRKPVKIKSFEKFDKNRYDERITSSYSNKMWEGIAFKRLIHSTKICYISVNIETSRTDITNFGLCFIIFFSFISWRKDIEWLSSNFYLRLGDRSGLYLILYFYGQHTAL